MIAPRAPLAPGARVHLVGIGGAGMSALAWILLERGHAVSGSDLRGGAAAAALRAMGATVVVGHAAQHVDGADVVAVSTAVPPTNPELVRARELGLPVLSRAELLAALLQGYRGVLVAGTHGKTTTTAMAVVCLQAAGLDPSFAIGGAMHESGTSAHHGSGDIFVAEADESDRSFLVYEPHVAIVTNVELDHHDHYADLADVRSTFAAFLERRVPGGVAVLCRDDAGASDLAGGARRPVVTYGEHGDADVRITAVELEPTASRFHLSHRGEDLGEFRLRLPGRHNVRNAAAAAAVALEDGVGPDAIRSGLAVFAGTQRRFQRLGTAGGVLVVDDYAHHPTEIAATLAAARQLGRPGRVIAAFQPHRYSRTAALGADLGVALAAADVVVVTDVYAAGEAPVPGVTGVLVADAARAAGADVRFVAQAGDVPNEVAGVARDGDVVLTLGAGDITEAGPVLLRLLEGRRA